MARSCEHGIPTSHKVTTAVLQRTWQTLFARESANYPSGDAFIARPLFLCTCADRSNSYQPAEQRTRSNPSAADHTTGMAADHRRRGRGRWWGDDSDVLRVEFLDIGSAGGDHVMEGGGRKRTVRESPVSWRPVDSMTLEPRSVTVWRIRRQHEGPSPVPQQRVWRDHRLQSSHGN